MEGAERTQNEGAYRMPPPMQHCTRWNGTPRKPCIPTDSAPSTHRSPGRVSQPYMHHLPWQELRTFTSRMEVG
eukprot:28056-Eustigmatos_ZCMA.PRE.1